ncbi:site-specific integrase [Weissella muntiaci]|uniref:Site-specific integrase n=1 Tax=Weissella muntiaci TaxID=2508881 RepID=A0A6C2C9S3_9LACO|nr:site-specific integrase [Weissella muntiaci]TYC50851.1 site-specific integrase [Weissella muntiaci]
MAITKKPNGKWRAVFDYKEQGERRRKVQTFKTKSDAKIWLAGLEANSTPQNLDASKILFQNYFKDYARVHLESGLKESTIASWEAVEKYIINVYFNNLYMSDLTRNIYQNFLNKYAVGHTRNTVNKRHQIVKMVIQQAFHDGLITTDPTYNVRISGSDSKDSSEKFLEADEFRTLLNHITDSPKLIRWRTSFMVYLVALSGIRAGEALALTTDDIDTLNKTISVNKTKQRSGESTEPKTKNAVRTIKMPNEFFSIYSQYIENKEFNSNNELFDGRRYATIANTWLHRIEQELGFNNNVSIHGLRHSHASYLISKGVDISYISKRLGHADITITMEVYAHLLSEKQIIEEEKTQNILSDI